MTEGWVLEVLCAHLEAILDGTIRRLLINVPPGCMKSLLSSVFFQAWAWGPKNRPELRWLLGSYSPDLTVRDNVKCRDLILSAPYRKLWGDRFAFRGDQNAKERFATDKTGFRIATSVGGLGTGERADVAIVDDPHNVLKAESDAARNTALKWFAETLPTRMNEQTSAQIVIMQRVHERDVSAVARELGFDHLCLPMEFEPDHPFPSRTALHFQDPRQVPGELLWPERFSREYLDKILKPQLSSWGGSYAIAGQLQQRPAPRSGGLFKRDKFQVVDASPAGPGARRVRGWDLAASLGSDAAWTCGVKMAISQKGHVVIEDVQRVRGTPGDVDRLMRRCAEQDGHAVRISAPQDPGQAGKAQVAHMAANLHGFQVRFSPETGDKEVRARPLAAQVEAGNVSLVRAPWCDAFLAEAGLFPNSQFKDQVDAASRAYGELLRRPVASGVVGAEVIT